MGIIWKYLDKRGAAASAVRDYGDMEHIISHTDGRIRAAYQKMAGIGSPQPDGMPHAHNPRAAEERIIRGIGDVDVLLERYRQAAEYMAWFQPAWEALAEDERYVLAEFYRDGRRGAVDRICGHFQIERSSAYNKKNRALQRLAVLLYGESE